jgi:hypothetical protein
VKRKKQVLVKVHVTMNPVEADVVRSYLESHAIDCMVRAPGTQSMLGPLLEGLGPIEFFVLEEDAEVAEELLKTLNPKKLEG